MLPDEKKSNILRLVHQFSQQKSCKIRDFAMFLGNLVAACLAVDYGWCHYKPIERQKYLALLLSDGDFDARMMVPTCLHTEFAWWSSHILRTSIPICRQAFARTVFSDASLSDWGASYNGVSVHGLWNMSERRYHINYLELLAAFLALRSFAKDLNDCEILLRIDKHHGHLIHKPNEWCSLSGIEQNHQTDMAVVRGARIMVICLIYFITSQRGGRSRVSYLKH